MGTKPAGCSLPLFYYGYIKSNATYTGIPDESVVSLITASVAEQLCGPDIRRQKQYSSFDHIMHYPWPAG